MNPPYNERIRQEWLSAENVTGDIYDNTAIKNKIADWWLSKWDEKIAEVEGLKEECKNPDCWKNNCDIVSHIKNILYNKAITDVLDILKK